ncbi:response regulator transcription factor [Cupriavidus basilensis]|uniref:response regulator transcription factor n=1 Tax=Cupriavidus TaxID=106589 RepID=UPI000449A584|nr:MULTISPECIES: response regulator [Cupriavidus]KDP83710.1 chemotaxis protein CheY [Cupriavidus sp. SK-3]KJK24723.1 chemotaxis protein CheY [Burkholderiaceae bacterium 16]MDF3882850.1 response regulator [Cupriavidus basilensis]
MTHKVLIADDEPNIVISLEFLMQQSGYEVGIARDGEEALAQMTAFQPDLVLLDIMLPLRSGFEVCQKIRENKAWDRVRVVMLSAKGRELEVSKGLALGADAYITKPFSTRELVEKVGALLAS